MKKTSIKLITSLVVLLPIHFVTASSYSQVNDKKLPSCSMWNDEKPPAFDRVKFPCTLPGSDGAGGKWAATIFTHEHRYFKVTIKNKHDAPTDGQIAYYKKCLEDPSKTENFEPTPVTEDIDIGPNKTVCKTISSNCTPSLFNNTSWKKFLNNKDLQSDITTWTSVFISASVGKPQPTTVEVTVKPINKSDLDNACPKK